MKKSEKYLHRMVNDWMPTQKDFFSENMTALSEPEQLTITSSKIKDLTGLKNISTVITAVVQKSIKNAQSASAWTDSGT